MFFKPGSYAADGSSRTYSGDEYVDFASGVSPYFFGRCFRMNGGIGGVFELLQNDASLYLFIQFFLPFEWLLPYLRYRE